MSRYEKEYSGSGVELCVLRQVLIDLCLVFQRPFCTNFPLHFFPQLKIIIFFLDQQFSVMNILAHSKSNFSSNGTGL